MMKAAEVRPGGTEAGSWHPGSPGLAPTVLSMLRSARRGLDEAADETSPGARYVTAHLAALRAAAAVVAARGEPKSRRRKPHSVWELLPQVEPALTEWAAFFAAGAGKPWLVDQLALGRPCLHRRCPALHAAAQIAPLQTIMRC